MAISKKRVESSVQDDIKTYFEKRDWLVIKYQSVSTPGWMDLGMYKRGGRHILMEVKRPGEQVDPDGKQAYYIDLMNRIGFYACSTDSLEKVKHLA